MTNEAPSFNHPLFADDSLVLTKANKESAKSLQKVLQLYEICSGQTVNYAKSSVMFSANTRETQKQQVMHELNIRSEARTEKCLGLPVYVGR
jgi:acetolactate synthase small subunit